MRKLLPFLLIGAVAATVYRHASQDPPREEAGPAAYAVAVPDAADLEVERPATEPQTFRCDGRERCQQMSSCEEARYFLANCPGVKMDGDGDGVPCEDQWCAHLR